MGDRRNLNVTSKGFRIGYRLHLLRRDPPIQRTLSNKTAINKDEVRGSVRRIPSIKLGTSKYLARRRKRTRKGEKVDGEESLCWVEVDIPRGVTARN